MDESYFIKAHMSSDARIPSITMTQVEPKVGFKRLNYKTKHKKSRGNLSKLPADKVL